MNYSNASKGQYLISMQVITEQIPCSTDPLPFPPHTNETPKNRQGRAESVYKKTKESVSFLIISGVTK